MKKSLLGIREELKKYARTISKIFAMDVGICDENLVRITGSGPQKIGEKIKGKANKKTLETKETTVILNPREDAICSGCSEKNGCLEVLEISTPIKYEDEIIGLISLVSFDENQKKRVLESLKNYLDFVEQMSELISIRFSEYMENIEKAEREKVLSIILNIVQKGVLRFNDQNRVTKANIFARKKIDSEEELVGKKLIIESLDDYIMGQKIYHLKIADKEMDVIGEILPFDSFDKNEKVFIFDDMNKINKNIRELADLSNTVSLKNIVGDSKETLELKERIRKVSDLNSTVLITGESGTGKELVARALHYHSERRNAPFVAINCAAIPDSLLESELFGYVKGAFTGADKNGKMGKFELANGGVLFLDEIGDMPQYLQAKLLRVIQERKITRIGSNRVIDLDIRIIAATNVDLEDKIEKREFREDLYYRLKVIPMDIKPLRKRKEDIIPIVKNLLGKYNELTKKYIKSLDSRVEKIFLEYEWPGNVRELENVVEFMINISGKSEVLTYDLLPEKFKDLEIKKIGIKDIKEEIEELEDFAELEKEYIKQGLKLYGSSTEVKERLAKKMGIGLTTLYRKIQKYSV